jgi:hypothetical protein
LRQRHSASIFWRNPVSRLENISIPARLRAGDGESFGRFDTAIPFGTSQVALGKARRL